MKNLSVVVCAIILIITTLFTESQSAPLLQQGLCTKRDFLLHKLLDLDLGKICMQDSVYLETLNADYDMENQRYYIEQPYVENQQADTTLLFLIDYHRPYEQSDVWLSSRITATSDKIRARIIFQPFSEPENIIYVSQTNHATNQDQAETALALAELSLL